MKPYVLGMAAAVLLAGGVSRGQTANPAPSLRMEPPVIEFGEVLAHQTVMAEVLILNEGDREVTIRDLAKSCPRCLEVVAGSPRLAPGEATVLTVWYEPGGLIGEADEQVLFETDPPGSGSWRIPVRAWVTPSYRIDQGSLLLEAAHPDDAAVSGVRVTPRFEMHGVLETARVAAGRVEAKVSSLAGTPGAYQVCVTAVTPVAEGMAEDEIVLTSSDERDPPCRIPAEVFLPPPIHVFPGRLRVAPSNREQLRILFLESRESRPFELVSVTPPNPSVRYRYFPGYGLERSRLNVYVYRTKGMNGKLGDLELLVRGEEEATIRIPIVVDPDHVRTASFTSTKVPIGSRKGCGCGSGT